MPDAVSPLTLDALSRAVPEPAGLPLFARAGEPGLFPATAAGKSAAADAKSRGWLCVLRTDSAGKAEREIAALTEDGMSALLRNAPPRRLVEDLVRAVEARQGQLDALLSAADQMRASLAALQGAAGRVLPTLAGPSPQPQPTPTPPAQQPDDPVARLAVPLVERLAEWGRAAGASQDCPLPDLFAALRSTEPGVSIGQFHDCLRRLHDAGYVYLHPWTGPLYALPEPSLALLIGHEIAYYVSRR